MFTMVSGAKSLEDRYLQGHLRLHTVAVSNNDPNRWGPTVTRHTCTGWILHRAGLLQRLCLSQASLCLNGMCGPMQRTCHEYVQPMHGHRGSTCRPIQECSFANDRCQQGRPQTDCEPHKVSQAVALPTPYLCVANGAAADLI